MCRGLSVVETRWTLVSFRFIPVISYARSGSSSRLSSVSISGAPCVYLSVLSGMVCSPVEGFLVPGFGCLVYGLLRT